MILKIKSANRRLLDILNRNPDTDCGLYLVPLKKGQIAGNAVNAHEYEVVFQDTASSYSSEESTTMDFQSYCSPLVVLHCCNALFSHLLKSKKDFSEKQIAWLGMTQGAADTEPCTIEVASLYIDSNWIRSRRFLLSKYVDGIEMVQQSHRLFTLKVTAKSVFEAFNLLMITALFVYVTNNGQHIYFDDNLIEKFGRILTNIENVPYFVFYLFMMRAVKSPIQFEMLKPVFENYLAANGLKVDMVFGATQQVRLSFITDLLEKDVSVLDIGCGDLLYYRKMMDTDFSAAYYAVDKGDYVENLAALVPRRYDADNLTFYHSLDAFSSQEKLNIILTEVIEHNPLEEAKLLVQKVLQYNFNKFIITTPNIEFNVFYTMEREFRHEEHCFEFTRDEFKTFINDCVMNRDVSVNYFYLGDTINGIQPMQGCIITHNKLHGH